MTAELTDGVILLRPFRAEDIVPVHEAILESFDELSRWMRYCFLLSRKIYPQITQITQIKKTKCKRQ